MLYLLIFYICRYELYMLLLELFWGTRIWEIYLLSHFLLCFNVKSNIIWDQNPYKNIFSFSFGCLERILHLVPVFHEVTIENTVESWDFTTILSFNACRIEPWQHAKLPALLGILNNVSWAVEIINKKPALWKRASRWTHNFCLYSVSLSHAFFW